MACRSPGLIRHCGKRPERPDRTDEADHRQDIEAPIDFVYAQPTSTSSSMAMRRGAEVERTDRLRSPGAGMAWRVRFAFAAAARCRSLAGGEPGASVLGFRQSPLEVALIELVALSPRRTRMTVKSSAAETAARLLVQSARLPRARAKKLDVPATAASIEEQAGVRSPWYSAVPSAWLSITSGGRVPSPCCESAANRPGAPASAAPPRRPLTSPGLRLTCLQETAAHGQGEAVPRPARARPALSPAAGPPGMTPSTFTCVVKVQLLQRAGDGRVSGCPRYRRRTRSR